MECFGAVFFSSVYFSFFFWERFCFSYDHLFSPNFLYSKPQKGTSKKKKSMSNTLEATLYRLLSTVSEIWKCRFPMPATSALVEGVFAAGRQSWAWIVLVGFSPRKNTGFCFAGWCSPQEGETLKDKPHLEPGGNAHLLYLPAVESLFHPRRVETSSRLQEFCYTSSVP